MKSKIEFLKLMCVIILSFSLVLISGCKTTKTVTDRQESYVTSQDSALSVEESDKEKSLDRQIVTQWMEEWYAMQQLQHSSEDKERIQETITITTDSTGAVTRTEERITDRSKASQSTQNASSWGQEYSYTIDSLSSRIAALELKFLEAVSKQESVSESSQTEKETKSAFNFPIGLAIFIGILGCGILCLLLRRIFS